METNNFTGEYNTDKLMSYGNPTIINKMIELFIKSSNDFSEKMSIAVKEKNILQVKQLAHCIKPSLDYLNINSLTNLIRDVELSSEINNDISEKINVITEKLKSITCQMKKDYSI
jgi:HPt (histidine-containing phosphotransfer) domain-containing protein